MPNDFHQLDWDATIEDDLRQIVRLAVREDLARQQDWTTVALVGPDQQGRAAVVVREAGVVAGLRAVPVLLDEMGVSIDWQQQAADGDEVGAGQVVAELGGRARDMLVCERPMLNLIGRLSGIASLTRQYVHQIQGTRARIYDTRKTTPGWRRLDKYAVRCGGGSNHRTGLFDAVLIKDNHLALTAGRGIGPAEAVRCARDFLSQTAAQRGGKALLVEVEIDSLSVLESVLEAGPDIVLLDNMPPDQLREAVARRDKQAPGVELEASGGVTLQTVREIAQSGVDRISVGQLTHSAPASDVALDWLAGGEA
jgi:nicotinate-nucleotide pyrophosphorylase (carboxylating)